MNKKNTIRLTESELKNIITESVKNVISELDYKTYANAAIKARRKHDFDRGDRFLSGAVDAFNRDYGYNDGDDYYGMSNWGDEDESIFPIFSDSEPDLPQDDDIFSNPSRYHPGLAFVTHDNNDQDTSSHYIYKTDGGKYIKNNRDSVPKSYSKKLKQAVVRGNKDLTNYAKGKYEYTKGKGWHLKDK